MDKGNPSPARLSVRLTQESTSAVAGDAVEQAETFSQRLSQPLVANVSDAVTNAPSAVSNQQNLIASLDALMKKLGVLVKVGDEVARVCSLVSSLFLHNLSRSFFLDPSLCQFSVEGAFRRNEGESISIILVFFS